MGSPIFPGIEHIIECGKSRRVHAVVWNPDLRGIESPADDVESIPRDFSAAPEANRPRNALQRSGVASRTLSRRCVTKTMEPGNMCLNARYGVSAVREESGRSAGASKWPRRNLNLPLAAGPRVRHIRADGAVAEWLKAAVC